MGRLTNLRPAIGTAPPTLPRLTDEHGHGASVDPWHSWYKLKRWCGTRSRGWLDGLRGEVLIRDGFICQWHGCGRLIIHKGQAIAHHVQAHRGDSVLFWDPANIICVCKDCHDGPIAKQEALARGVSAV